MQLRLHKSLSNAGDTIVEVLVVLAIVGSALSISYATANKSLLGVRQSEEHAQALQLVQQQLEDLYAAARADAATGASTANLTPPGGNIICMDATTASDYSDITASGYQTSPCYHIDAAGPSYDVWISYDGTSTYTAQASWDDVSGRGQDNVSLVYRLPV